MQKRFGEILNITQLLEKLKKGGWGIQSGREVTGFRESTITHAHFENGNLTVRTTKGTLTVTCTRIREIAPWMIAVDSLYPTVQSEGVREGRGKQKTTELQLALGIYNLQIESAFRRNARTLAQTNNAVEKAENRDAEQKETRRVALEADFNRQFAGKTIIGVQLGQGGMCLVFTDGSNMNISIDGGDTYDAWVDVNGMSLTDYVPSDS